MILDNKAISKNFSPTPLFSWLLLGLCMVVTGTFFFGFWGSLVFGALLTGLLTFLLFRRHSSRLLRVLMYLLVGFFTLGYPLSGLFTQVTQRNSFDGLVQVGLIVYLFGLSLYSQIEAKQRSKPITA